MVHLIIHIFMDISIVIKIEKSILLYIILIYKYYNNLSMSNKIDLEENYRNYMQFRQKDDVQKDILPKYDVPIYNSPKHNAPIYDESKDDEPKYDKSKDDKLKYDKPTDDKLIDNKSKDGNTPNLQEKQYMKL